MVSPVMSGCISAGCRYGGARCARPRPCSASRPIRTRRPRCAVPRPWSISRVSTPRSASRKATKCTYRRSGASVFGRQVRENLEGCAMRAGTVEFDGIEYPDGNASDPNELGLMQGSPPPLSKRIRFEDDQYLVFPKIRWSLSHMRELVPTAAVWRGSGTPSNLGVASRDSEACIDALAFDDLHGRRYTWADSLAHTYTDGIIVLHRGMRIYERYFGALQPHRPHACFSITKSFAATLAATLIHEGTLDEGKTVSHYLPEMAETAYADATLRQVLDMQVGVEYSEDYADPQAGIWDYSRAGGLRARGPNYAGPGNYYEYLVTLRK